jgi:hypothetical protein
MKSGYRCSTVQVSGVNPRPCCARSKTAVRGQGGMRERRERLIRSSTSASRRSAAVVCAGSSSSSFGRDLSAAPRFIQHKNEAKAFYAFLSQVYDYIVNPGTFIIIIYYVELLHRSLLVHNELSFANFLQGIGRWR